VILAASWRLSEKYVQPKSPPPWNSKYVDAYRTATQSVGRAYPGAQWFADIHETEMDMPDPGSLSLPKCKLKLRVRGLNAFGGPVENNLVVELTAWDRTWKLDRIYPP
jgi:hypothetical protein